MDASVVSQLKVLQEENRRLKKMVSARAHQPVLATITVGWSLRLGIGA